MSDENIYQTPLATRYASKEMSQIFSERHKHILFRKLWVALARAEKSLGLPITDAQIAGMEAHLHEIDIHLVHEYEKNLKHDVMAHLHAFADLCPEAKGIIHLGATSCFVTDNADIIQMREGLKLLQSKIVQLLRHMADFAEKEKHTACLSFTHLQPAQPTTYGKRMCLWMQDLVMDLHDIEDKIQSLRFLGAKGATGTQASFLSLFDGNHAKVKHLDLQVAKEMGFDRIIPVSGQTYTRKQDVRVFSALSSFGASAHKIATDIRLLAHMKELAEPFGESQVGSSAMPYKRNPIRAERICGLARYLLSLSENPLYTASTQWLERSLDDSANRRLCIPEAFLVADALLNLLIFIFSGLTLFPAQIRKNLLEELPFMAIENILMYTSSKKGKDRQVLHEKLRVHSLKAEELRREGKGSSELLELILSDPLFDLTREELSSLMKEEHFIGRAAEQTQEFLHDEISPLLKKNQNVATYKPLVFV